MAIGEPTTSADPPNEMSKLFVKMKYEKSPLNCWIDFALECHRRGFLGTFERVLLAARFNYATYDYPQSFVDWVNIQTNFSTMYRNYAIITKSYIFRRNFFQTKLNILLASYYSNLKKRERNREKKMLYHRRSVYFKKEALK